MSDQGVRIVSVRFKNYKALADFEVRLKRTNILIGPNNAGKSTLIGAFRALAICLRRLQGRKPDIVSGPGGRRYGIQIPTDMLPISTENIHTDYSDSDTLVVFTLSNRNELKLYFPLQGPAVLIAETYGTPLLTSAAFRKAFPISLAVVPVLGPVEHRETLFQEDTVVRNLATHRASRNFRNYWYHFPEDFQEFSELVAKTWQGVRVEPPDLTGSSDNGLAMFCEEKRIPREIYWVGSGFQIWCQLLTHLLRTRNASLVVIDEPEIYLHADLQRQLVGLLKSFEADVIVATHSTEIMSESDPADLVLIDKTSKSGERIKNVERLQNALTVVGSAQNVTLSRLSRARRILFVEGDSDFKRMRAFARHCGYLELASGLEIVPIPSGGFSSWRNVVGTGWGISKALDDQLLIGALYDRDYFTDKEIYAVETELRDALAFAHIFAWKEFENYLLLPKSLNRAIATETRDRSLRKGVPAPTIEPIEGILSEITHKYKEDVYSQRISREVEERQAEGAKDHGSTLYLRARSELENVWSDLDQRLTIVPGKDVLRDLRTYLMETYKITVSDHKIIQATALNEIPSDMLEMLEALERFRLQKIV